MKSINYLCIEDIPKEFLTESLLGSLEKNGGNVISVEKSSGFGFWLKNKYGFEFTRGPKSHQWDWLVIFR